jgi:hypothetical protein
VQDKKIPEDHQPGVADQKNPFGNFPIRRVVHKASFGETRGERKQTPCFLLD